MYSSRLGTNNIWRFRVIVFLHETMLLCSLHSYLANPPGSMCMLSRIPSSSVSIRRVLFPWRLPLRKLLPVIFYLTSSSIISFFLQPSTLTITSYILPLSHTLTFTNTLRVTIAISLSHYILHLPFRKSCFTVHHLWGITSLCTLLLIYHHVVGSGDVYIRQSRLPWGCLSTLLYLALWCHIEFLASIIPHFL